MRTIATVEVWTADAGARQCVVVPDDRGCDLQMLLSGRPVLRQRVASVVDGLAIGREWGEHYDLMSAVGHKAA